MLQQFVVNSFSVRKRKKKPDNIQVNIFSQRIYCLIKITHSTVAKRSKVHRGQRKFPLAVCHPTRGAYIECIFMHEPYQFVGVCRQRAYNLM